MAGTGKRADQKKTLMTKLYGHEYFGKRGITSRGTKRDRRKRINLKDIELNIESFINKGVAKKTGKEIEIDLSGYKILDFSKDFKFSPKDKLIIKAKAASKSAMEKIKGAGGEVLLQK